MFDVKTLVGGGAIAAVVIALWDYIKIYLSKIYGLFFVRMDLGEDLQKACTVWLMYNCKSTKITLLNYVGKTKFVKPKNKTQLIAFEAPSSEPTIYFYKKRPLIVGANARSLTFFRWTFNANKIVEEMLDCYNEKLSDGLDVNERDRFYIRKYNGTLLPRNHQHNQGQRGEPGYPPDSAAKVTANDDISGIEEHLKIIKWKKEDIGQPKRPDPISCLALSDECLKAVDDLKLWRKSETWYKDRYIPWKKGILTFGKPGNGKSSFAKALAIELNMPVMIFNLTDMSNTDFQNAWDSVKNNTPCIVLLEDIDAVFDGRKNIAHEDGGLSFDCLLNCLDGIENADGILTVATTNNVDKIDIALGKPNGDNISTRPGRIDRAIELGPPDKDGRYKIAKRILIDFPNEIDKIVEEGNHDSGAQFQERCSRLALKLFWDSKK